MSPQVSIGEQPLETSTAPARSESNDRGQRDPKNPLASAHCGCTGRSALNIAPNRMRVTGAGSGDTQVAGARGFLSSAVDDDARPAG